MMPQSLVARKYLATFLSRLKWVEWGQVENLLRVMVE